MRFGLGCNFIYSYYTNNWPPLSPIPVGVLRPSYRECRRRSCRNLRRPPSRASSARYKFTARRDLLLSSPTGPRPREAICAPRDGQLPRKLAARHSLDQSSTRCKRARNTVRRPQRFADISLAPESPVMESRSQNCRHFGLRFTRQTSKPTASAANASPWSWAGRPEHQRERRYYQR